MKKIFSVLLIAVIVFLMTESIYTKAGNVNPYAGKYIGQNNVVLKLGSGNNCTIIYNAYKEAFYFDGKYVVKDNKIDIILDKDGSDYYGVTSLKGVIEGSRISLYDSLKHDYQSFSKE